VDLNDLLPRLEASLRGKQFDPSISEERYRMAITDYACAVVLPPLLKRISVASPKSRLDVLPWHERCFDDLEAGRLDMVVKVAGLGRPTVFRGECIFTYKFVCVVSKKHPLKGQHQLVTVIRLENKIAFC
jgi:DNA-binding transcriptional LysR family regulator